ncbi:MAG: hypothetical protein ACLPLR_14690 [Terriglobales bacterium]
MNRKTLFALLACALLGFSMLGCGTTKHLQSIQLSTSNQVAAPPGTLDLTGIGAQIQLYPWGNYSNGSQKLLTNVPVAYQIVGSGDAIDPSDDLPYALSDPPQTVEISTNGLLTAVQPAACTFYNTAVAPATSPAWALVGTYTVTATQSGFTSPPVFVAMASAEGYPDPTTNPTGECGPQPTQ